MRKTGRAIAALVVLFVAVPLLAATTAQEFYLNLLRRGVADFNAGRFEAAEEELRIAAFGLLESVDAYQTAHVYLALTADRLGHTEESRRAVGRVQAAQRIQARYAQLPLPAEVRSAFDALVQRVAPAATASLGIAPGANGGQNVANGAIASRATPRVIEQEIPVQEIAVEPPRVTNTTTTRATQPPPTNPGANPFATQPAPNSTTPPTTAATQSSSGSTTQPTTAATQPPRTTTQPATTNPITTQPSTGPTTQPTTTTAPPRTIAQPARATRRPLADADRALDANDLPNARAIFREHLGASPDRATLLRIGEGLYRARDFSGALTALRGLGELQLSERPYRYYIAVALYETGQYAAAKQELLAALPHIELTPDVERYRAKILGAIN